MLHEQTISALASADGIIKALNITKAARGTEGMKMYFLWISIHCNNNEHFRFACRLSLNDTRRRLFIGKILQSSVGCEGVGVGDSKYCFYELETVEKKVKCQKGCESVIEAKDDGKSRREK